MSSGRASTRHRLLDAARRLLERESYSAVSMGAIAGEADVSRQAAYLHFGSKAELLLALVAHVDEVEGLPHLLTRVRDAPSGVDALKRFVELVAELTPRVYRVGIALAAAAESDSAARAAWTDRMDARRATCRAIAERLGAERSLGEALTVVDAADLLWALSAMRVFEDLVEVRGYGVPRYRAVLEHTVLRALTETRR
jgi:AcrR family transcriptional regulator